MQIKHSAEQRNFTNKNATTPEINAQPIPMNTATSLAGFDTTNAPSLGYVQIAITPGVNVSCHVRVWATGRDRG